ncbi:P-aminobenzoate N-oxygenase AurF [Actinokineospora alba]|uniref:p-aminobenzoate N-oxygenase AurF n=1 Tax=Actinokineospora alba TaxID=504798 RepID=A0A1H0WLS6_9PSEU|nr:diiron oxygenase [Actinokineospora alba]TDP66257.1 para-aminobenzoate N-oxygenase AurF [Actinokineospora alba]SDJ44163.1 P-aminobenzoate N-oxygenase AurF [Actinokineospora alba]SDP91531.1 P-aminobenzoate N-oxygenase AurF [Actinokineospora alba]
MARALEPKESDQVGARLLEASVRNSYDPHLDIDWDAPLAVGKAYMPFERVSLYGTDLWRGLGEEQRIELSKHEIASIAGVGLWFEIILMQLLVRYAYDLDPTSPHAQYALTEIGDETRHSIMFAKAIARFGAPVYGPGRTIHELGRIYKTIAGGPSMFAAVLVAEETTDRLQRSTMDNPDMQPLIRMVNRIHVVEEARHVRYAREEVIRAVPKLNRAQLEFHRLATAVTAFAVIDSLVNPRVYLSVGIDPREGRAAALANPNFRETRRWMAEKVMEFLTDVGMVGGPSKAILRRAHLLR